MRVIVVAAVATEAAVGDEEGGGLCDVQEGDEGGTGDEEAAAVCLMFDHHRDVEDGTRVATHDAHAGDLVTGLGGLVAVAGVVVQGDNLDDLALGHAHLRGGGGVDEGHVVIGAGGSGGEQEARPEQGQAQEEGAAGGARW